MDDYIEISAKTVEDAITEAAIKLETTSDMIEYEVVDKGSSGFLGFIGSKPVVIRARRKEEEPEDIVQAARNFTDKLFKAMGEEVTVDVSLNEEENTMDIEFSGPDMGVLIGKRGQTLDSIQYLISLVVNRKSDSYIRVRVDTENYRERRKATLENLAKNIAFKVKRTRHSVVLEPMNPYERRIIHSALQSDKYVETHSEGEEPYRKIVVTLKKEYRDRPSRNGGYGRGNNYRGGRGRGGYRRRYDRDRKYNDYNDEEKIERDEQTSDLTADVSKPQDTLISENTNEITHAVSDPVNETEE